jgi:hypothetical protein
VLKQRHDQCLGAITVTSHPPLDCVPVHHLKFKNIGFDEKCSANSLTGVGWTQHDSRNRKEEKKDLGQNSLSLMISPLSIGR